jgi:hypothetical protein
LVFLSVFIDFEVRQINHPGAFQDIIDDHAVSDPAFYTLIILYSLMILGSVIGNVFVITAVLKSPYMRKVRILSLKKIGENGFP